MTTTHKIFFADRMPTMPPIDFKKLTKCNEMKILRWTKSPRNTI